MGECDNVTYTRHTITNISNNSTLESIVNEPHQSYDCGTHIFESLVFLIGVIGVLANGIVIYVLYKSKQLKRNSINLLFMNQTAADLYTSVWLAVVYAVKLSDPPLTGTRGRWLCILITSENFVWLGIKGSSANLACIAIERYLQIVHPVWHKAHFQWWFVKAAIATVWIMSAVANEAVALSVVDVVDGQCIWSARWVSATAKAVYGVFFLIAYFIFVVGTFLFCYGRIIATVRRRMRIFAAQHANNQLAQAANRRVIRSQLNAVKTMLVVSAVFVVSWGPCDIYSFISYITKGLTFLTDVYYFTLFVAFLSISLNPFIYAANYDLVKDFITNVFGRCRNSHEGQTAGALPINVVASRMP